jgi:carboxypeptidase Q
MKKFTLLSILIISFKCFGQMDEDVKFVKQIHDHALTESKCYDWLKELCSQAGPRVAGSKAYAKAVEVTNGQLREAGATNRFLQEVKVEEWRRGVKEEASFTNSLSKTPQKLKVAALGNSIGTGLKGIKAEVIEVQGLDDVRKLGKEKLAGKIVFYNRPMNPTIVNTFGAYGGAVDQRVAGASVAAENGAIAVLVRSMTLSLDDYPHTGTLVYKEGSPKIPALAISTNDAEKLSKALKQGSTQVSIKNTSMTTGLKTDYNVIGEIKGSEYPEEVIVVGGHLDAWDLGDGAHDDGAGCVQAMQVLHTLSEIGYQPKRTIRCVLFANEENGLSGGLTYSAESKKMSTKHIAALESDAGGFSPRAFSFEADTSVFKEYYKKASKWLPIFESYGIQFNMGGSGADIGPLKPQKPLLIGLRPDSQRYFDFHHTSADKFEAINKRELQLGAAAMTSLIYLIDKYGI